VTGAPSGRWCAAYEDLIPALATAMRIICLQLTPQQVTSVADDILETLAAYCQRILDSGN